MSPFGSYGRANRPGKPVALSLGRANPPGEPGSGSRTARLGRDTSPYLRTFPSLLLIALLAVSSAVAAEPAPSRVDVLFFHRTFRCPDCLHMEAYAAEAVAARAEERVTGRLLFRAINLDDHAHAHYAEHYGVEISSVVLARFADGQEVAWTNLPLVWELVEDRQNFLAYLEMEISGQLEQLPAPLNPEPTALLRKESP